VSKQILWVWRLYSTVHMCKLSAHSLLWILFFVVVRLLVPRLHNGLQPLCCTESILHTVAGGNRQDMPECRCIPANLILVELVKPCASQVIYLAVYDPADGCLPPMDAHSPTHGLMRRCKGKDCMGAECSFRGSCTAFTEHLGFGRKERTGRVFLTDYTISLKVRYW
jgi:hypothetical protein